MHRQQKVKPEQFVQATEESDATENHKSGNGRRGKKGEVLVR